MLITLNHYYGLLINICKRIAGNYLKFLSPSDGVVGEGLLFLSLRLTIEVTDCTSERQTLSDYPI